MAFTLEGMNVASDRYKVTLIGSILNQKTITLAVSTRQLLLSAFVPNWSALLGRCDVTGGMTNGTHANEMLIFQRWWKLFNVCSVHNGLPDSRWKRKPCGWMWLSRCVDVRKDLRAIEQFVNDANELVSGLWKWSVTGALLCFHYCTKFGFPFLEVHKIA